MQEHWIKNIEEKWVICYDDCVICKSNVNLSYNGIRTLRTNNSLKLEIFNKVYPQKNFIPEFQCEEYKQLVERLERPTSESLLGDSISNLKI
jgi:hypothetical protein